MSFYSCGRSPFIGNYNDSRAASATEWVLCLINRKSSSKSFLQPRPLALQYIHYQQVSWRVIADVQSKMHQRFSNMTTFFIVGLSPGAELSTKDGYSGRLWCPRMRHSPEPWVRNVQEWFTSSHHLFDPIYIQYTIHHQMVSPLHFYQSKSQGEQFHSWLLYTSLFCVMFIVQQCNQRSQRPSTWQDENQKQSLAWQG